MVSGRCWLVACLTAVLIGTGLAAGVAQTIDGPSKMELSGAEHRLKKFEDKVRRARGQPFAPDHDAQEAMRRIRTLKEKFPNHPQIEEMVQRVRKALLASKGMAEGALVTITPEMLAYREDEKKLKALFATEAEKAWQAYRQARLEGPPAKDNAVPILKAFPPPQSRDVTPEEMLGRLVLLEELDYPRNEFQWMGRQYCFVGTATRGFYFVELSNRGWLGAYEAVRRYKRQISSTMDVERWTLVGKVTGLQLLPPQAGEEKTVAFHEGWVVEPEAIRIAGHTFAAADPELELGGWFAGEKDMEKIKSAMYTVRAVPDDVTPERLVEIFATAIKEKNYPLYLDCIDPARRQTPKALSRCAYHWDWHQHRFATFYVHVKADEARVRVVSGYDSRNVDEGFFLSEEEKMKLEKIAGPLREEALVYTRAYDERGRQYGSPKPFFLERIDHKRWYITSYSQPF